MRQFHSLYVRLVLSILSLLLVSGRNGRQKIMNRIEVLEHSFRAFRKKTLKRCYYVHSVRTQFVPVWQHIPKTRLYNFDPLKPHFYIVKLGFTGVYIIFLIFAQNIDCGYSLEPPRRGVSNEYPQSMFLRRDMKKYQSFYLKIFSFRR